MAEVKWIKYSTDIFNDEKMAIIDGMPEADSIIVVWTKLLCLAGKQNNGGVFMMTETKPYTDVMLASIFRRNIDVVRLALQTFEEFGMIEIRDGVIVIPNWSKYQSLDSIEKKKEYDRKYQEKRRNEQKNDNRNDSRTTVVKESYDVVSLDKDKEKEYKENTIITNSTKESGFKKPTIEEIREYCMARNNNIDAEKFYNHYESKGWKIGKATMKSWKACVHTWERTSFDKTSKKEEKFNNYNDDEIVGLI